MKRVSVFLATVAISLLPTVMPVLGDEVDTKEAVDQKAQQKNECMLVARNCGNSVISIQDKIESLKEEIARGRTVYTPEELIRLKQKLDESAGPWTFCWINNHESEMLGFIFPRGPGEARLCRICLQRLPCCLHSRNGQLIGYVTGVAPVLY